MARRLVTLGGIALSAVVTVGTWLYVAGIAPPFPLNAWAFNALLLACLAYALAFGRAPHPSEPQHSEPRPLGSGPLPPLNPEP